MVRGDDEDQLLLPEGDDDDVRVRDLPADQPQIAPEGEDIFHHGLGVADIHPDLDLGVLLPEEIEDVREIIGPEGVARADPDPSGFQSLDLLDDAVRLLGEAEDPFRIGEEDLPGVGQFDASSGAVEELQSAGLFQQLDLIADRRLAQEKRLRGLGEALVFRDLIEDPKLVQMHRFRPDDALVL